MIGDIDGWQTGDGGRSWTRADLPARASAPAPRGPVASRAFATPRVGGVERQGAPSAALGPPLRRFRRRDGRRTPAGPSGPTTAQQSLGCAIALADAGRTWTRHAFESPVPLCGDEDGWVLAAPGAADDRRRRGVASRVAARRRGRRVIDRASGNAADPRSTGRATPARRPRPPSTRAGSAGRGGSRGAGGPRAAARRGIAPGPPAGGTGGANPVRQGCAADRPSSHGTPGPARPGTARGRPRAVRRPTGA